MQLCLTEAREAYNAEEVPVGALVVAPDGEPIARAHNLTVQMNSPIAHAEILAITEAARVLENFRLVGCTLYVTQGALHHVRGRHNRGTYQTAGFRLFRFRSAVRSVLSSM